MRTTTTERFTTALSALLHADFGAMSYAQLKKAAKGLITKPHKLSHGELLEELSQLREVSQRIIDGPTTERLTLRIWDHQEELPRLSAVMTQEERQKMNRKNALKRLKKTFSEAEFKNMSRSTLNRRIGASLNVYRNDEVNVWFHLTSTTIHLLQVEGTLEGLEEGDIDTDSADILSFDWRNMPDLKNIVTQALDARVADDGPDDSQPDDNSQTPDSNQHDDSVDADDIISTDSVPDDGGTCDEAPAYDGPDADAHTDTDGPDGPVVDTNALIDAVMARVQKQLDAEPDNMSWGQEVAYEAHKMLKDAPFDVPGLCLNDDFKLQFNIERRPYYYELHEDTCSATFQCLYPERDSVKIPVTFDNNNVISAALALRFDVERALDIDVPKDRFVGLPTAQEIDGVSIDNAPTAPAVEEAPVAEAAKVYEAYCSTLLELGDPAFSAAGEKGGTFTFEINGKECTLSVTPSTTMRGNFDGSQEVSGKYTYTATCDGKRQRIKSDEHKDIMAIMDLLVRALGPSDTLYDVYDDINLSKCISDSTIAYFVIQPDGTFAVHVIKDGDKDNYAILTLDDNDTVQPPIASIR